MILPRFDHSPRTRPGPPRRNPLPASSGADFDSLVDAVRNTQADLGRYRTVLERINSMVSQELA